MGRAEMQQMRVIIVLRETIQTIPARCTAPRTRPGRSAQQVEARGVACTRRQPGPAPFLHRPYLKNIPLTPVASTSPRGAPRPCLCMGPAAQAASCCPASTRGGGAAPAVCVLSCSANTAPVLLAEISGAGPCYQASHTRPLALVSEASRLRRRLVAAARPGQTLGQSCGRSHAPPEQGAPALQSYQQCHARRDCTRGSAAGRAGTLLNSRRRHAPGVLARRVARSARRSPVEAQSRLPTGSCSILKSLLALYRAITPQMQV